MAAKEYLDISGRLGLTSKFYGDINRASGTPSWRILAKDGEAADGVYNPFVRYGFLSPANDAFKTMTVGTGAQAAIMGSSLYDEVNDDFYLAERGTTIFKGDGLDDTSIDAVGSAISGTAVQVTDMNIYQINGVKKIFYAYRKTSGSGSDIGYATLPFASQNDDWLSADATGAFNIDTTGTAEIRMTNADNGFMYVICGAFLHKVDGTTNGGANGTVTANVLVFPATFSLVDVLDYRGQIFIPLVQRVFDPISLNSTNDFVTECGVYIWDRQSTQVNMRDYIPIQGVREILWAYVSPKGTVRLWTIGANRFVQLREFNGATFEVIEEMGLNTAPRFKDSMAVAGNMTVWIARDGYIYAHGSVNPGDPEGIFKLGQFTAITTASVGAIVYGGSNTYAVSGMKGDMEALTITWFNGDTTAFVNNKWYIHGTSTINSQNQIANTGNVYSPIKFLPTVSTVNYMRVYFAPLLSSVTSGSTVVATIKFYINGSTTESISQSLTRQELEKGYIFVPAGIAGVFSVQMLTQFSTGQNLGTYDFAPHLLEIDYTVSDKIK